MDMITFYTQALGSSHLASKKPCQDNGIHYNKVGVCIAIVCDGHGGESYVRSDKGSRIAAEVAKNKILEFIESTSAEIFTGKKNAVTVVPTRDPRIDKQGHKREVSMLSESEMELLKQNILYTKEVELYPDIESLFRDLFKNIYTSWKSEIENDVKTNPFSNKEKEKLGSSRIEKAYGTTLMAAVRTPDYWFAFHIGDGRLYACDKLMKWYEPVPWDCNCFLNITTSLCDHNPVAEFRYAFDGTGDFPLAFALGSDGIDDTFLKTELIHKFYSQLLCVLNERKQEEVEVLLADSLSDLSKRGSHDDMSVAVIIDDDNLSKAVEYYKIITEVRKLNSERDERQNKLKSLREKIDSVENNIKKISEELDIAQNSLSQLTEEKKTHEKEFSEWEEESRKRVVELKEKAESVRAEMYPYPEVQMIKPENNTGNDNIIPQDNSTNASVVELSCIDDTHDNQIESSDTPDMVYKKANDAMMSEEGIAQMDKEADAQVKEILNPHN